MVDNDQRWFQLIHDFYQRFKYQNIMTEDVIAFFNENTKMNLTPMFDQYLRHTALPKLQLKFADGEVSYRWQADEQGFAMPVRVGTKDNWQIIKSTTEWKSLKTSISKDEFGVDRDRYFIEVEKL